MLQVAEDDYHAHRAVPPSSEEDHARHHKPYDHLKMPVPVIKPSQPFDTRTSRSRVDEPPSIDESFQQSRAPQMKSEDPYPERKEKGLAQEVSGILFYNN